MSPRNFFENVTQRLKSLPLRKTGGFFLGNDIDIPGSGGFVSVQPIKFSHQPFDSISFDGLADFFADRNAQSCFITSGR